MERDARGARERREERSRAPPEGKERLLASDLASESGLDGAFREFCLTGASVVERRGCSKGLGGAGGWWGKKLGDAGRWCCNGLGDGGGRCCKELGDAGGWCSQKLGDAGGRSSNGLGDASM
jgi:hypothetical protein